MLEDRIDEWAIELQAKAMRAEGVRFLTRLLQKRFGELPDWVVSCLQSANPEQLEIWGERLLEVDELEALFDLREMRTMLADRIDEWSKELRAKGRREGRQEGRQEGERAVLRKLLTRRFGTLDPATLNRLEQASTAELERWAENIFDAHTLEEVFTRG